MSIRIHLNGRHYKLEHVTTNEMKRRTGVIAGKHRHPVFHLIYITEGRGSFRINDELTEAEPGMLYVINPNEWHQFSGDEHAPMSDLECTFLLQGDDGSPVEAHLFELIKMNRNEEPPAALKHKPFRVPRQLQPWLAEGFRRILESHRAIVTEEHLEVIVADLLMRVEEVAVRCSGLGAPNDSSVHKVMDKITPYINANLGAGITLSDLAAFVHLTPNYLCRVFKEQAGESPMAYLARRRMTEAEKLLAHTDLPVYLIAEKMGYGDPSYFARAFRRYAGVSPQSFRNEYLG